MRWRIPSIDHCLLVFQRYVPVSVFAGSRIKRSVTDACACRHRENLLDGCLRLVPEFYREREIVTLTRLLPPAARPSLTAPLRILPGHQARRDVAHGFMNSQRLALAHLAPARLLTR